MRMLLVLVLLCLPATADSTHPELPAELTMNKNAGRGSYLFVTIRLEDGESLLFLVDTGSPITLFAKSLEPRLGNRLGTARIRTLYGNHDGGVYTAPKLYLGNTQLLTGTNIFTDNFTMQSLMAHRSIKGILGMDCLRHYCIQLDFDAEKVRFLDPDNGNAALLGKAFPIAFPWGGIPVIDHSGLLAGKGANLLIDTGCHIDGFVDKNAIKGHYLGWWYWLFGKRLPECLWDGQTYTHLHVRSSGSLNLMGLRFLARHLVILDFPQQTMYLKRTSIGPLDKENTKAAADGSKR
jgi:hypothetical protein